MDLPTNDGLNNFWYPTLQKMALKFNFEIGGDEFFWLSKL